MRNFSSNGSGGNFSESEIEQVWNKGRVIADRPSNEWRSDVAGNLIKRSDYGRTSSVFGWEVDHIMPVSKGGTDQLSNLQPLQWEKNREKGDTYPYYF